MIAILTGLRWNLDMVLICTSFMARDGEHSLCSCWSLGLLPLKKLCSVHLCISSLGHWFLGSLVFEYILDTNSRQMYSWQFSPILWVASSFLWLFLLLFRSILVSCSPICQSFLLVAEPFEFYLESHCLFLLVPLYLALDSEFQVLLWSLIHFKLILVQGERHETSFSLCMQTSNFPSNICWRACLFSIIWLRCLCQKSGGHCCVDLYLCILFWFT
jgi:hypothetical protein